MTDKRSKASIGELAWPGLACWAVVATYFVYASSRELERDPQRYFVLPFFASWVVAVVYAFKSSRAEGSRAVRTVAGLINASASWIVPFLVLKQGEELLGDRVTRDHLVGGLVAAMFVLMVETYWKPRHGVGRFTKMIWPAVAAGGFYAAMRVVFLMNDDSVDGFVTAMRINEVAGSGWFWMTMASGLMVLLMPMRDGAALQKLAASVLNALPVITFVLVREEELAWLGFWMRMYFD